MIDLVCEDVGGRVVDCNDQFFGDASNLIKGSEPVWKAGVFTDRGKWMDGWETRRRREEGHDWCVLALGVPGRIDSVVVDTSHFTGNYPEQFSIEACGVGADELESADWVELIGPTPLQGDSVAAFEVNDLRRVTHVRLNVYPDGGVARLRVRGEAIPSKEEVCPGVPVDLVSAMVGGVAADASDMHYSPPSNLLRPTESTGMWDGWETRRRRGPGHDWAVFRLGIAGVVERLVVDTRHFKGNAPGWVSLEVSDGGASWETILDRVPVQADDINDLDLGRRAHADHVKLSLHPDGGMARLRVMGRADPEAAGMKCVEYLNALFPQQGRRFFDTACGSSAWIDAMVASRPFTDVAGVLRHAEEVFDGLGEEDWLSAFAVHPRIGERGGGVANREQAGAADASNEIRSELSRVNEEYEEKFGFTFIVYARGKNAEKMLEVAATRISNSRDEEIANAAGEQRRITETRLRHMLCQDSS